MANAIDPNAETHPRHRRNWQRLADMIASGSLGGSVAVDGVTIEDTGTVLRVKDLGISTAKLANNGVTFAKFQTVTTDRLVGRDTAGTGNVEELTVGGGIEFTGSGGIQSSAFTGDATKTAGGTALTLATVNSNVGTFNNVTVNGKGLVTAASNVAYLTGNQTITFTGAITGSGATTVATTLANSIVGLTNLNALTTKGDLLGFSTTHARLAVGSDEQDLVADSAATTGLKWANRTRVLFSNTANSAAIANTTTETNFDKSFTLPANFFTAGRSIRLTAWGTYSASGTPSLTTRVKIGSSLTVVPTSQGVFNNASNRSWRVDATFLCQTTGATGTVFGTSLGNIQDASNLITMGNASATVDTTGTLAAVLSAQWGTASVSNTITLNAFILEVLN